MDKISILRSEDPQFEQQFDGFLKRQVETGSDIE